MKPEVPTSVTGKVRSRQSILEILKRNGPQEAQALSARLGVTAMAVRQHLYELSEQGLVTHEFQPRPIGRPAKVWALTDRVNAQFPDSHAELTVGLLDAMQQAFGSKGLDQLLAVRKEQVLAGYQEKIPQGAPLPQRLEALAALRSAEGYMAGIEQENDGTWLLVENHCPICAAAAFCRGLCAIELDVFQKLLGDDVTVTRTDHIQAGARRCAYRVELR